MKKNFWKYAASATHYVTVKRIFDFDENRTNGLSTELMCELTKDTTMGGIFRDTLKDVMGNVNTKFISKEEYLEFWECASQEGNWNWIDVSDELTNIHQKNLYTEKFQKIYLSVQAVKTWHRMCGDDDDGNEKTTELQSAFLIINFEEIDKINFNHLMNICELFHEGDDLPENTCSRKNWQRMIYIFLQDKFCNNLQLAQELQAISKNSFTDKAQDILLSMYYVGWAYKNHGIGKSSVKLNNLDGIAKKFWKLANVDQNGLYSKQDLRCFWNYAINNKNLESVSKEDVLTHMNQISKNKYTKELDTLLNEIHKRKKWESMYCCFKPNDIEDMPDQGEWGKKSNTQKLLW